MNSPSSASKKVDFNALFKARNLNNQSQSLKAPLVKDAGAVGFKAYTPMPRTTFTDTK